MDKSQELEREALALGRQYGVFFHLAPGPVKEFLRKLIAHLGWQQFKI